MRWLLILGGLVILAGLGLFFIYFKNSPHVSIESPLQKAIDTDDANAVEILIKGGVDVNAQFADTIGSRPIVYAVGNFKKNAAKVLLTHEADPNLFDNGDIIDKTGAWAGTPGKVKGECRDNAVTVAVIAYNKDPKLLNMVLAAGGDPNTLNCGGNPVIMRFINDRNLEAIRFLKEKGANLSLKTNDGTGLVLDSCQALDWDVAWTLLELGAPHDQSLAYCFQGGIPVEKGTLPWSYAEKVWNFLKKNGIKLPPLESTVNA